MYRYRITFLAGLAVGFVLGTRAGRERYEQMKKLARNAADNPAVQQAAGAVQSQATDLLKSGKQKVADGLQQRVPKMAESAKQAFGNHAPGRWNKDATLSDGASSEDPVSAGSAESDGGAS